MPNISPGTTIIDDKKKVEDNQEPKKLIGDTGHLISGADHLLDPTHDTLITPPDTTHPA